MRQLVTLLFALSIFTVTAQTERIIATYNMTAGEIIVKNAYIEFNENDSIGIKPPFIVTKIGGLTWDKNVGVPNQDDMWEAFDRIAASSKMRAARFRFLKTLTYNGDGLISCSAKTAEDLNISNELFQRFIKELENENEKIEQKKKENKGGKVIIYGNNDYLSNLLEEPKDLSTLEIKDNGLTAREIVEQNIYIPYTREELAVKAYENEYEKTISYVHPAYRAAMYRFYKNVKQDENGICTWTIQSGKELNMSEDLFRLFANETTSANEFIKENAKKGMKTSTTIYNDKYLNELLDDEHAKRLIERRYNIRYMIPGFNRVEIQ